MSAAEKLDAPYEVICDTSDRDAWLDKRVDGIGASEISLVLGEAPEAWGSALSLYAQKIGAYERDLSDVEAVFWGNQLEGPIIAAYAERTGRRTRKEGFLLRSKLYPWALCTLDGRTWEAENENSAWPLEVKNVSGFKAGEWVDGPPSYYYYQVQQQMLVTGEQRATVAALLGGQRMVWADVHRDDLAIRRIINQGAAFWDRVQRRDLPTPDGSEGTRKALGALYPQGSGVVVLPHSAIDAADELTRIRDDIASLTKRKDTIENTVRAALGGADSGVMTDGRSWSWKQQTRRATTVAESTFRVLRLHQAKGRR
jgi:putative phage-type endonuclease